jgi:hypothetical protein
MAQIRITCKTELQIPVDLLHGIQGNLKEMTTENFEKLKKSILTHGFNFPLFVWKELKQTESRILGGKPDQKLFFWVIDGHGRLLVIRKLIEEGYACPELPCVEIEAANLNDAKKRVLIVSSQYHTMTDEGLYEFMHQADLDAGFLDDLSFSSIDIGDFKENFFEGPDEKSNPALKEPELKKCPNCGCLIETK